MRRLVLALLVATFGATADADEITIKGVKIGLTLNEVNALWGPRSPAALARSKKITVGGIVITKAQTRFDSGERLNNLVLAFDPDQFSAVFAAVSTKYPATKCENSTVQNNFGAAFDQIQCRYEDERGNLLILTKYAGKVTQSTLSVVSARLLRDQQAATQAGRNDL